MLVTRRIIKKKKNSSCIPMLVAETMDSWGGNFACSWLIKWPLEVVICDGINLDLCKLIDGIGGLNMQVYVH